MNNKGKITGPKNGPVWDNTVRVNHQNKLTHLHPKRNYVPTAVLTKSRKVPVNAAKQSSHRAAASVSTARRVNTAASKPNVNNALPTTYSYFKAHSPELKFNLFSVSQMCDKKINVLFTNTECVVLSSDFKLLDESQVLLKGNLVRGLPSKLFENDHTCVACQKDKQHKASRERAQRNEFKNLHTDPRMPDLEELLIFRILESLVMHMLMKLRVQWLILTTWNSLQLQVPVNAAKQSSHRAAASVSIVRRINTAASKPNMNNALPTTYSYFKAHSPDQEIFDSECYRHMTGNKSYLTDYQEINSGFLLHLEEMLKELFDESQVLLKVPRNNNMYSFDLKNVILSRGLTCLFTKATLDESNLWHIRLGHINFKTIKTLVKGNLVRGLPSKLFENDHTCVACQKDKQHKASRERAQTNEFKNLPTDPRMPDLEELLIFKILESLVMHMLMKLRVQWLILTTWNSLQLTCYGQLHQKAEENQSQRLSELLTCLFSLTNRNQKGLQVMQRDDGIFISQDKYVVDILKKFDFTSVKTESTPIKTNKALLKDEEAVDIDVHLYRSMIGSLVYLTASRPNIMFVVCTCARFQVTPKVSHLYAVKRIFRYLKG
nr:hypothetical protein [Tanacetum cinerariifolium]